MIGIRRRVRLRQKRWKRHRRWRAYDSAFGDMRGAEYQATWLGERPYLEGAQSMFSIGPGSGRVEVELLKGSQTAFGYAEADLGFRRALEKRARRAGVASLIHERQHGYEPESLAGSYDVILSIASWYSWELDEPMLSNTRSLLAPTGVLVIALWSRDDFFARMTAKDWFVAEHFSSWLSDTGVEHSAHRLEYSLSMDRFLRNGRPTRKGNDLLTWYAYSPRADPGARDRLRDVLVSQQDQETFRRAIDLFEIPAV